MKPKYPSTRICWYYYQNSPTEWEEFADIECEIIENAFKNQRQRTELDLSMIDLERSIMTMKNDQSKQYSIKRMENISKQLRKERFCPILEHSSEVINDWDQENGFALPQSVEHAAAGILIEGEKLGYSNEAQWIANHLLEVKHNNKQEIGERCIALYTRDCFLYKLLNKTLREDDLDKHNTLGPFAFLLSFEGLFSLSDVYRYKKKRL
ncbi:hypothetical protein I4U23_016920 [Adineta vaga]|nr:hypothetical protein I4U23_016920 [Adineta vaga]